MTETLISLIILVSATGHMTIGDIYNYLPLETILYFLCLQQSLYHDLALFPRGETHTFISERSFVKISACLDYIIIVSTDFTGHGSTKRYP